MTLTAPAHICGKLPNPPGKRSPLIDERNAWIANQVKAGHSIRHIGAALGVVTDTVLRYVREARREGMLPPAVVEAAKPIQPQPDKRIVICDGARVSLPRLPGDDAESVVCTHRPETDPRFSLVRVSPTTERQTDVAGAIAEIRRAWEARA